MRAWLLLAILLAVLPRLVACAPVPATAAPGGQRAAVARPIPGQRPPPDRVIPEAGPDCPATPVEVYSGPSGVFFERDGGTVRVREPEGPWRAGQTRPLVLLPTIYYSEPSLELVAEQLDDGRSEAVFFGPLEGPGYQFTVTLPTRGCWRLSARMGADEGSVIVRVQP